MFVVGDSQFPTMHVKNLCVYMRDLRCNDCEAGKVALRKGETSCDACELFFRPNGARDNCVFDLMLLVSMICSVTFFTLSSFFLGLPIYIRDGSVNENGCGITCTSLHYVLFGKSVEASFKETQHHELQQSKVFTLKAMCDKLL